MNTISTEVSRIRTMPHSKIEIRNSKMSPPAPRFDAECWITLAFLIVATIDVALMCTDHLAASLLLFVIILAGWFIVRAHQVETRRLASMAREDWKNRVRPPVTSNPDLHQPML